MWKRQSPPFSCHPEPFTWVEAPRYPAWQTLVERLNADPDPAPLRELDPAELWQIMLTVVRKDRFSDGTFAACSPALTVIANAIREQLLDDRRAGRPFDRYGLRLTRPS